MFGHSGIGFPYEINIPFRSIWENTSTFGGLGRSEPDIVLPNFTNEKNNIDSN